MEKGLTGQTNEQRLAGWINARRAARRECRAIRHGNCWLSDIPSQNSSAR
ncbi:hypothetical protein THTE_3652 [Thermogutta terrifontis]|uniref:Uncharacterized protein n=1 Tax=Thermogutta terrifontis TaxID=1331910 RepID=A0A286RJV4_9BACT|nr:hypothetical protein THTE_3652 [Thermogutta terrifontis]